VGTRDFRGLLRQTQLEVCSAYSSKQTGNLNNKFEST